MNDEQKIQDSVPTTEGQTKHETSYRHVLKYIGVLGGVSGLKSLVKFVRNKITTLILGTGGMGISAKYQNIAELLYCATNLGFSFNATRNLSELFENGTRDEQEQLVCVIRTWALLTGFLAALLCLTLASVFCNWEFAGDMSYVWPISVLSFFVFIKPLEEVECSIVKGMRRLKSLAMIETATVIGTFLISIPLYYFLGFKGIVFALVTSGAFSLGIHFFVTLRMFAYRVNPLDINLLRKGIPMIKLGVPYVLAGVAGAFSVSLVYEVLGNNENVGLFKIGCTVLLESSYVVFAAMESDYFPRLSSACHEVKRMNEMANQQIHANILFITPLLIIMALLMPHIIRFISSNDFISVAPMVVFGVFHLLFQAVSRPIAFYPLAKGNSLMFLVIEIIYDAAYIGLVYVCYQFGDNMHWYFDEVDSGGLIGTGVALSLANLFELLVVSVVYAKFFGFRYERKTLMLAFGEFLCLIAVVPFCLRGGIQLLKYGIGITALCVSLFMAWRFLSRESNMFKKVAHKILHHSGGDCC